MPIEIRKVEVGSLPLYAAIPETFVAESVFRVELVDNGLEGIRFAEEKVTPYPKYDDDYGDGVSGPANWPKYHDVSKWGIFIAFDGDRPVGGVTVAIDTPAGITTPFESEDIAALWDIRVHPQERRRGIGSMLFQHAAQWAKHKGYRQLKIETQNVNVPACRFYAKQGCKLGAIHRHGYAGCPDVAHEAMLLWYLEL
jgi:GNAT superfamily N-acetyltransferase